MKEFTRFKSKILLVLLCFFLLSQIPLTVQVSANTSIVVYGSKDCESCVEYISEFTNALKKRGITNFRVRYFGTDPEAMNDLNELNDRLAVPSYMRSNVAIVIEDRFVFAAYVHVNVVIDFLIEHKEDYQSLSVYRKSRDLYIVMDENGEIKECTISQSLEECLPKSKLTKTNFMSLIILPLIFACGIIIVGIILHWKKKDRVDWRRKGYVNSKRSAKRNNVRLILE